ncbi:glycosyltransferase family 4 protein [Candidatus Viridilinea mediisalina]|uniref:Glycosyl transferase family 1 n=1 Tax=Candidatus Viridilinea mediisalina TaxID=2024553 RepID=A0A2A6RP29_9CHLR|nr:glycosyltransferase family 4 protein [Candidatus Viridilinea mediisalina]PDW04628.1 glycosyl transferase family 1 [Candidatus Viridilinea mediisalina]
MRILLLTQVLPFPPDAGPKIKTYHLLQYLGKHHEVTLVSLIRSAQEEAHAEVLRKLCSAVYTIPLQRSRLRDAYYLATSMLRRDSFLMRRDHSDELHAFLHGLTRRQHFDIIHADQLNMAQFAVDLPGGARVIDQHNAVWTIVQRMAEHSPYPRRVGLELEARHLRRYEARICARFDGMLAVSQPDLAFLELAAAEVGVRLPATAVIPIAVDALSEAPVRRVAQPRTILSMATMFWPPNVDGVLWFAHEVYPLIKAAVPDAEFAVVGARPPAQVRQLGSADPSIHVTGYVADPQPFLQQAAALIVPVRAGGGMRVKILEALARGLPIVSTTIGYEGIRLQPGEHLLVGDTPQAFAAAVIELLRHPSLGQRLAKAGRSLAAEVYDWRVVNPQVEQLYEAALNR